MCEGGEVTGVGAGHRGVQYLRERKRGRGREGADRTTRRGERENPGKGGTDRHKAEPDMNRSMAMVGGRRGPLY